MNPKTTTKTITQGLTKKQAQEFILFVKNRWDGQPSKLQSWVERGLILIGVNGFKLNSNVTNGVITKLERKSGIEFI